MIEGPVIDCLMKDDAVQAACQGRVRPDKALQSELPPYLIVTHNGTQRPKTFGGVASISEDTITLEAYGRNKAEAQRLAKAADAVMVGDRAKGTKGLTNQKVGQWFVQGCFSDDAVDGMIPDPHADDAGRWVATLDYSLWYAKVTTP